ncbi:DUF4083 family protein [Tumebacillus sp. DT12]|uniref:DUF4083 family protein n=1 Tax=Tumebacillus lacus TaxID=2995335 RepID=A0ABT3WW63_9BACL|nr:DUF4083 family protein [Tumebacillus lacus]MCX7568923.1 DUF4083 family protein [Tumebacillus lacus]
MTGIIQFFGLAYILVVVGMIALVVYLIIAVLNFMKRKQQTDAEMAAKMGRMIELLERRELEGKELK